LDGILAECHPFVCGDDDMDDAQTFVACFTVSNDSIRIYDLPSSRRNAMWGITNREKMLTRYPGVRVGRLAVASQFSGKGIGSEVLVLSMSKLRRALANIK
jgi:hypothetical protein